MSNTFVKITIVLGWLSSLGVIKEGTWKEEDRRTGGRDPGGGLSKGTWKTERRREGRPFFTVDDVIIRSCTMLTGTLSTDDGDPWTRPLEEPRSFNYWPELLCLLQYQILKHCATFPFANPKLSPSGSKYGVEKNYTHTETRFMTYKDRESKE